MIGKHICTIGSACVLAAAALASASAAENLVLSRDGFFYVGGKPTVVDGREYISGQMYVEVRTSSSGSPVPGHWLCRCACGHSFDFSWETKREAELLRKTLRLCPYAPTR